MILDPINRPVEDTIPIDDGRPPLRITKTEQEARKESRKAAEISAREEELNSLSAVLSTDEGRAVILRILKLCQPYRSTVLSTDKEQYLLAEGRRGVAHWLINEMGSLGAEVYPNLLIHNAKKAHAAAQEVAGMQAAHQRRA